MKTPNIITAAMAAMILTTAGCEKEDARLVRMAEEHVRRQTQQSQQMVELQRQVAQGARQLVEADAAAREELASLQRELGQQHDQLEADRRALASQRRMDPILAAAITSTGVLLACLLPLVLCWYLLHRGANEEVDAVMAEVLVEEFASDQPRLLPPPASRLVVERLADSSSASGQDGADSEGEPF